MSASHRTMTEGMRWVISTFGAKPVGPRPHLVATYEQRRAVAGQIRAAVEPIDGSLRGKALRDRALLIELEESADGAAELLAEAEALGLEVVE